jgi:hypothetical protein
VYPTWATEKNEPYRAKNSGHDVKFFYMLKVLLTSNGKKPLHDNDLSTWPDLCILGIVGNKHGLRPSPACSTWWGRGWLAWHSTAAASVPGQARRLQISRVAALWFML